MIAINQPNVITAQNMLQQLSQLSLIDYFWLQPIVAMREKKSQFELVGVKCSRLSFHTLTRRKRKMTKKCTKIRVEKALW